MVTWGIDPLELSGIVFVDGLWVGPADLELIVERENVHASAHGDLRGSSSLLQQADAAKKITFRLNTGETLEVQVNDHSMGSAGVEIHDPASLELIEILVSNRS